MLTNKNLLNLLSIADYYPDQSHPTRSYWIYEQVSSLKQYGYNSLVVSPSPYIPSYLRKYFPTIPKVNYNIIEYNNTLVQRPLVIKLPKGYFYKLYLSSLEIAIINSTNFASPRLIHAHFGPNGIGALKTKKKLDIPLITSFYGYDSGRLSTFLRPYYRELIKCGDVFLALSNDMKLDLLKLGFPEEKILIQHLGIDTDRLIKSNKPNNNKFVFTIVARFDEVKGIHDAIKAFRIAKEKISDIELRIIGSGTYNKYLNSLVTKYKINDSVIFVNNLTSPNPRELVLQEINNCDVFILTSYTTKTGAKEGTPVVLMEAQSFSKPCISTIHAGIPEIVINNQTGLLVEERNINQIAESMLYLIKDENFRNKLGHSGREYVEKEFNLKTQIIKLNDIYSKVLGIAR